MANSEHVVAARFLNELQGLPEGSALLADMIVAGQKAMECMSKNWKKQEDVRGDVELAKALAPLHDLVESAMVLVPELRSEWATKNDVSIAMELDMIYPRPRQS
ncbi:MAG: hypothetical protein A3C02_01605 [Candidatus Andersenbacteria bacterium RIFCSPHIGHO2_02_FULL_45_11]|uniref:Uncharacterized protein n=1 Tax=Candidatus Andersenbacteria bacterium RIFCSPHIGHO2_12_FULL_45_11 TaxID=1797281 RepID=A0A1G1X2Q4_9BACT|nr:MAG: hypothetical protein A2805_02320 [Candidatus Andersenbacteria bacterium RIFCSPHIGHO2_01_FULL_46_36]OGY32756.1 MAG: hypothetical protein A3C02_01605 [Candidatus Andersenbacteria bacterium RIFCSPHIGHO2_02_FULL_45_11]OGY34071.1 MAG: hypothetical protein A3D99_02350 [Candidatus Andersenbacteria bacterium RIFCSPHIGHO2_12_FULL_45_11]